MTRPILKDDELQVLREGAVRALEDISRIRKAQARLETRAQDLMPIVRVYEQLSGTKLPRPEQAPLPGTDAAPAQEPRIQRGQVMKHVDEVLSNGGEFNEGDLRDELEKRFGVRYSRSAVYSALRRGATAKGYINTDGKWKKG